MIILKDAKIVEAALDLAVAQAPAAALRHALDTILTEHRAVADSFPYETADALCSRCETAYPCHTTQTANAILGVRVAVDGRALT